LALLADINEQAGKAVQAAIEAEGGRAAFRKLDVSDPASCAALAEAWIGEHGRIDGLVNNAAIFSTISMKPFWEITVAEWDRLMAVNLRGPWLLTSALLPGLRAAQSASIVNIASDAVWMGRGGYLHYIASKGFVRACFLL
jgi:NAD(P)-dependent dehydrogenase (short-subunit alcohol dehydrogenase family)